MLYYNEIKTRDNLILSCDMVRITFKLSNKHCEDFNKFCNNLCFNDSKYDYKVFESRSYYQYRYILNFKYNESSFVVGLALNSFNSKDKKDCFIEFNPNKCLYNCYVNPILDWIKAYCIDINVSRFDFAIDIPCPRSYVSLSKDLRDYNKVYKIEKTGIDIDNVTEYLGHRNNNGFVKLYNKQKESGLNYNLTRLEITLSEFDYDNFIKYLPQVYYLKDYSLFDLNELKDTDKVLLSLLLQNNNPALYLKMLGRVKQEKFKKFLFKTDNYVSICESDFYNVIFNIKNLIA